MPLVDNALDSINTFFNQVSDAFLGCEARNLIELEAVVAPATIQLTGNRFVSVIELQGAQSSVGKNKMVELIDDLTSRLENRLNPDCGLMFRLFYEFDPTRIKNIMTGKFSDTINQANRMGIDVTDILTEKIEKNAPLCHVEKVYMAIISSPMALGKQSSREAQNALRKANLDKPVLGDAQAIHSVLEALLESHEGLVESMIEVFAELGQQVDLLSSDRVLSVIQTMLSGDVVGESFLADSVVLEKQDISARQRQLGQKGELGQAGLIKRYLRLVKPNGKPTMEAYLPKPLRDQILTSDMDVQGSLVFSDQRVFAPMYFAKHTQDNYAFNDLINNMIKARIPLRVAFTITPNGLSADSLTATLTSIFSWVSHDNKLMAAAREQLKTDYNGAVVGISAMAVTWAPIQSVYDTIYKAEVMNLDKIRVYQTKMKELFTNWGGVVVSNSIADPVQAVFATIPALVNQHVSSITPAPLCDVVAMLPIARTYTPWSKGAALFRTADGLPYFYEQVSELQTSSVTLVTGAPGLGKSSLMNSLNLSYLVQSSFTNELPILRGVDFSYASKPIVDLIRQELPENKKHQANYVRMQNDKQYSYNCFDTFLGCREPTPPQFNFLVQFLQTVLHPLQSYASLSGLCSMVIRAAYADRTDKDDNPNEKKYSQGKSTKVDKGIERYEFNITQRETSWWELVDLFFDEGDYHLAIEAQKYAVPTLEDIARLIRSKEVIDEYSDKFNGESITKLAQRTIGECIDEFAFLGGVTQFDVSQSKIFLLDMSDLVPSKGGDSPAIKRQKGVCYLLAMRMLSADFFLDNTQLTHIAKRYHAYHKLHLETLTTLNKRFYMDETQRAKGVAGVESAIEQFVEEGRKAKISVMVGTPQFDNLTPTLQKLATSIFLCGAKSQEVLENMTQHFALTDDQKKLLGNMKGPSKAGASFLAIIDINRFGQKHILELINTEGPLMLGAVASDSADRYVRDNLYAHCTSPIMARKIYAQQFPTGSVKKEVKQRSEMQAQGRYQSKTGNILEDLVIELLKLSENNSNM